MQPYYKLLLPIALFCFIACRKQSASTESLTITGFSAGVFASGDAVSIYGTGFDPDPSKDVVLFNGVPGEVATASANRLQVVVPLLIGDGKITVQVGSRSVVSTQTYSVVNILQGTYHESFSLTADKKYLLRGNVSFLGRLTIDPGTVIYGEKATHGQLTVTNVYFNGTAQQPIVFTSDQLPGNRAPGDWVGLTLTSPLDDPNSLGPRSIPLGQAQYVRVEYAGYHVAGSRGVAYNIASDPLSNMEYLEAAYSAGDGFDLSSNFNFISAAPFDHLVAAGCAGDDFFFTGSGVVAQFGLGLKDPSQADQFNSNGIAAAAATAVVSNFTLIGYNPAARHLTAPSVLTNDAGAGVLLGEVNFFGGEPQQFYDNAFGLFNSVIAGGWTAGIDLGDANDWNDYEDTAVVYGNNITVIENNFITGTAPRLFPYRGGAFGRSGYENPDAGFEDISTTWQYASLCAMNDTAHALDLNAGKDDLGIGGAADVANLGHPLLLPASGSPLLTAAAFPSQTTVNLPYINKALTYVGAFGPVDWTSPWCNFNPQLNQY